MNPSSADGLEGCTDDQFGVKRLGDPSCADRTRIGTVTIDTPLLDKRPAPPSAEARTKMLTAEDIADCVMLAVNLPSRAVVEELLIRPRG